MFGDNFNLDELRMQLEELKRKIEITKEADGVLVKFTDPELLEEPGLVDNMLDPNRLAGMKNMMPGMDGIDLEVEQVPDGMKLKTNDPDGIHDMLSKILDPDFMQQMMQQLADMMSKLGDMFGGGSFFEDEEEE